MQVSAARAAKALRRRPPAIVPAGTVLCRVQWPVRRGVDRFFTLTSAAGSADVKFSIGASRFDPPPPTPDTCYFAPSIETALFETLFRLNAPPPIRVARVKTREVIAVRTRIDLRLVALFGLDALPAVTLTAGPDYALSQQLAATLRTAAAPPPGVDGLLYPSAQRMGGGCVALWPHVCNPTALELIDLRPLAQWHRTISTLASDFGFAIDW